MHTPQGKLNLTVGRCALPGLSGALCAQCTGSLGAGTVHQGLSAGGLALSSPGNLILMT